MNRILLSMLLFASLLPLSAQDELPEWLVKGKVMLNLRYRLEQVDQDHRLNNALASTLRTRLGYETGDFHGLRFMLEFENVARLGGSTYNDTINRNVTYPIVADPAGTEVNRLQVSYKMENGTNFIVGRQRLIFDNQRFIGAVGFRQNEQTFDAAIAQRDVAKNVKLTLGYLANANRIYGESHPTLGDTRLQAFVVHSAIDCQKWGKLALFGYFLENETLPLSSHSDLGFYWKNTWKLNENYDMPTEFSYAKQSDYADGNANIDADYLMLSLAVHRGPFTVRIAQETLGGDGTYAFQTPLATLHGFNGWADAFLTTPNSGLEDSFIDVKWQKDKLMGQLMYHNYQSDQGSANLGDELDLLFTVQYNKLLSYGIKYAQLSDHPSLGDIGKAWLFGELNF